MPKVDKYHKPVNGEDISNNIGLFVTKSRPIGFDTPFPEIAKFVQSETGGYLVWKGTNEENNYIYLPAGIPLFIEAIEVLASGDVDGVAKVSDATMVAAADIIWCGGR